MSAARSSTFNININIILVLTPIELMLCGTSV